MTKTLIALLFFCFVPCVHAADVAFIVNDQHGNPVSDVVATIPAGADSAALDLEKRYEMRQEDVQFSPHVIAVPKGARVHFPNLDRVRHHVYSFSKGNRFELKLYGRQDDRSVAFERVGMAAIGCNIHDEMVGFINVVDTPHVSVSGSDGQVTIPGLAATPDTVFIWHPSMGSRIQAKPFAIPAAGQALVLSLPKQHMH